ncbi:MAG: Chemotaxis response regulator protein-glutamate methylesterase [Pseudomonadota bacterium]|jgi:two-component system chemotaxis response regulator CheB
MDKIRLLLVDDSLVIRRALRECFRDDPEIEVVGVAETGIRALQQIESLKPDVVTLDIEMPEMDGLETLRTLRAKGMELPVIIFSKHTSHGANITMQALELGASDVVAKPEAHGGKGSPCEIVKRQLRSRVRALGRKTHKVLRRARGDVECAHESSPDSHFAIDREIRAVAIAVSTGGPPALLEIVSHLRKDLEIPIFITQHMPPVFTRYLAERLSARSHLRAIEAQDGMVVEPGVLYIAPGDYHLEVAKDGDRVVLHTSQAPHENSCRPSADVMFRSLARLYGSELLGVVMTGMGQDGRHGSEVIKAKGGLIVAQDQASSLVWGMPRAVISAGFQDAVVTLTDIAKLINQSHKKSSKEN